jgi:uncharacterized membrane protein YgdD (TMEM256/DUF423 family)
MNNLFLVLASINGFLAVSLGAFAAHGLKSALSEDLLNTFQTGVQYHMYHTLALLAVGVLSLYFPTQTGLRIAGFLFLAGIIIFSGSLYVLALTGIRWLGAITPLGGIAFLAGWALLGWSMMRTQS